MRPTTPPPARCMISVCSILTRRARWFWWTPSEAGTKSSRNPARRGFGYLDGEAVQEFYLEENTSKTVIIRNVPLSALVGFKYDSKTGKGIPGCRFELRYLSGNTSGTGGTVIGTYVTGPNGAFTVTGLKRALISARRYPVTEATLSTASRRPCGSLVRIRTWSSSVLVTRRLAACSLQS